MRHGIVLATASFVLLLIATTGSASIGGFVAYQDSGDVDSGIGVGLKLEQNLSPQLSVDERLGLITGFDFDWTDDLLITSVEANINWNFPMMGYTPYVGAGVGYYSPDTDWFDSSIGYNLHGGVKLDTGRGIILFAELKYLSLDADGEAGGVDLGGPGLVAGISWGAW